MGKLKDVAAVWTVTLDIGLGIERTVQTWRDGDDICTLTPPSDEDSPGMVVTWNRKYDGDNFARLDEQIALKESRREARRKARLDGITTALLGGAL